MPNFTTERRAHPRVARKKIVVLYHGDCSDGFGGAWAAWKKFGSRAEYVPLFREEPLPKGLVNKTLYFIDFTPNDPKEVAHLMAHNKQVTAIDHHITTKDTVLTTHKPLYALHHSGATLAWQYFHPREKTPLFLRYIEDRDIWTWKMPHAKEILSAVEFPYYDFRAMTKLVDTFETAEFRKKCVAMGMVIKGYMRNVYKSLMEISEWVQFESHRALAVNAPHYFASELGNLLVREKKTPFAIVWYRQGNDIKVSLRAGGKVDVAKIAEKYGGGGHKAAAGFRLNARKPLPWKLIRR